MSVPILATKLYIPPHRPKVVLRPRLIERLNEGMHRKLTLISAPAGFGKTTLVSEWITGCEYPVSWLSLDEGDNDPTRFLVCLIAALQTIEPDISTGLLKALQSTQSPPIESILITLINDITNSLSDFILVLDDYHVINSKPVDNALIFLLDHLPPQMHLVIATREDPELPLARLRARDLLTELRVIEMRFTLSEATEFLNQAMSLNLSIEDIAALESRTEGWITGLQLAALSMQGYSDTTNFIKSFTGSHHFVLDYLVEEVLQQQPKSVQDFLLCTSILDRLCGSLCDAVLFDPSVSGQETLEYIERSNLFIIPLDNERRWYRYHHLFAELLQQRLLLRVASSAGKEGNGVAEYHLRASQWYEDNDLEIEAFRHAVAADDVARAERLAEGKGLPLQFRGALTPILRWLESLPTAILDARPSLWSLYAQVLLAMGQSSTIEQKLQAAEAALQNVEPNDKNRDLVGRIAATRAMLALSQGQIETIITQSHRALRYLNPDNLSFRTSTIFKLGYAYQFQGNRIEARKAYDEVISISQKSGNIINEIMASIGLGNVQEADNQLALAEQTYQRVLQMTVDLPFPFVIEAYLGLARIFYQWNNLDAAEQYLQQSVRLAPQLENTDRPVACDVFLAHLKLARGDVAGAIAILARADQFAHQHNFVFQKPEIAATQVLTLLRQGDLTSAAHIAQTYDLPISQARVYLGQGDPPPALAVLVSYRRQMEAKGWADEQLKAMVLQAVAFLAQDDKDLAVQVLGEALALAEPGGFIRLFLDEGAPMEQLLSAAASLRIMPEYTDKLLAAFYMGKQSGESKPCLPPPRSLIEPLSQRELEILQLVAQGLSNREIGERLFLALNTIKGHNRIIFNKLQVQRRTEAVARARELDLL